MDVSVLSALSGKIARAEKSAMENYHKLIQKYPKNITYELANIIFMFILIFHRVLRDYARFVEEILRDDKTAHVVSNK